MTEHLCKGSWIDGKVDSCPDHVSRGTSAPDVSPFDDRRTRLRVEGVAKTGQISSKGTVEHLDYYSGRVAAKAKPVPIHVVLRDLPWFRDRFVYREGRWIEKATGKEAKWVQQDGQLSNGDGSNSQSERSATRKKPGRSTTTSGQSFAPLGVSTGRGSVSLPKV